MRSKMRGALKKVGRCPVPGHGQRCVRTSEVRETPVSRAQEKRAWKTGFEVLDADGEILSFGAWIGKHGRIDLASARSLS